MIAIVYHVLFALGGAAGIGGALYALLAPDPYHVAHALALCGALVAVAAVILFDEDD
jgi:NADH:ubiquinone oxidoreductase subunit 6 (subunit J)